MLVGVTAAMRCGFARGMETLAQTIGCIYQLQKCLFTFSRFVKFSSFDILDVTARYIWYRRCIYNLHIMYCEVFGIFCFCTTIIPFGNSIFYCDDLATLTITTHPSQPQRLPYTKKTNSQMVSIDNTILTII